MKNFQLSVILFGLLCVIQSIPAEGAQLQAEKAPDPSVENCTIISQNVSELEPGDEEELKDPEPSEEFKAEIQQHFKLPKVIDNVREKRSAGVIYHGNNVALQTYTKYRWLGCSHKCGTYTCPGTYFEGDDWTRRCWGEVFRIYRMHGPGCVRVGDYIGLYFPAQNRWFGCPPVRPYCGKYDCPGSPKWQSGFASRGKWRICGGEVFRIFARNKQFHSPIRAYDDIMLYFVAGRKWVSLHGLANAVAKPNPCPGLTLPPSPQKYEICWAEVFRINKQ